MVYVIAELKFFHAASVAEYHSGEPVEVFIRIIPFAGDAGRSAVVPTGIIKYPVALFTWFETDVMFAAAAQVGADAPLLVRT